jgi:hypothetical protein
MTRYSAAVENWRKNGVNQLFIDFKKVYDSVTGEILYNSLIGFGIPIKLPVRRRVRIPPL